MMAGGAPGEAALDQLRAEPIVKQPMRRDRTDEAKIRQLIRKVGAGRSLSRGAPR
jgi:hypothetical protein